MSDFLPRPQIEKRMLPLLDVSLSLLGIMLLIIAVSEPTAGTGWDNNVLRIQVANDGKISAGSLTLAAPRAENLDQNAMEELVTQLRVRKKPLVLIYFPRPSNENPNSASQSIQINAELVFDCAKKISEKGFTARIVGDSPEDRGGSNQ